MVFAQYCVRTMFTVGRSLLWDVYLAIINIEIMRQLLWKRFLWACLSFQEIQYTIALTDWRLTEISLQRIGHSIPKHFPIAYILAISDFGNDRNPQERGYTIHRTLVEFGETSNDQWFDQSMYYGRKNLISQSMMKQHRWKKARVRLILDSMSIKSLYEANSNALTVL